MEKCPGTESKTAGQEDACQGCPNQKICSTPMDEQKPSFKEEEEEIRHSLKDVKNRILIMSGKGGVGKSSLACHLARHLSSLSKEVDGEQEYLQVGLLDLDICGPSQPQMMNLGGEELFPSQLGLSPVITGPDGNLSVVSVPFMMAENGGGDGVYSGDEQQQKQKQSSLQPLIWKGPRKNNLISTILRKVEWDSLDYMIVDTPPGTSDEHLSLSRLLRPIAGAILVTTPQEIAWQDVRRQVDFCLKSSIRILGLVINMTPFSCPSCKDHRELAPFGRVDPGLEDWCAERGIPILQKIPVDPAIGEACDKGEELATGNPSKDLIAALWDNVRL